MAREDAVGRSRSHARNGFAVADAGGSELVDVCPMLIRLWLGCRRPLACDSEEPALELGGAWFATPGELQATPSKSLGAASNSPP